MTDENYQSKAPRIGSELTPEEAERILKSFSQQAVSDGEIENDFAAFLKEGKDAPQFQRATGTLTFLIWMQDDQDRQPYSRFGMKSIIYRSLFGVLRAALFDTLAELVIVWKPCGVNWDKKQIDGRRRDTPIPEAYMREKLPPNSPPKNLPRKGNF